MKACLLIGAPRDRMDALDESLRGFETLRTSDEARAALLANIGCFQAIILDEGFLSALNADALESPVIRLGPAIPLADLPERVATALQVARESDQRRAEELTSLCSLPYATYLELVRFRATRGYLLGLMRRHRGSVTEASLAAGIARESLHRQLRRHDVDADAFREADAP